MNSMVVLELPFQHGAACSSHISMKATEYNRAKTRSCERPSPNLYTQRWVYNASLLFFPPSFPPPTLFPQSTCKSQHATPPPPHPQHLPSTSEDILAVVVALNKLPPSTYGPNAFELLIATFSMSTTYHNFVNSHQEQCFSYFHTRDIPTAARILDKVFKC